MQGEEQGRPPVDPDEAALERAREDEAIRRLNARVHRHMGMTAAVLGIIAAAIGLWQISKFTGLSPWAILADAMPLFLVVLVILALGVVFSLGTSRIAYGIELLIKRGKKKAGE